MPASKLHRTKRNVLQGHPSSLTKLRLPVLWIKLGGWPRGWKYSAISLCNLIFSSCATPSPRCGCLGLSVPPPLPPPLLPLLEPDDLPLLLHPMLSPKLLPLMSETEDLARRKTWENKMNKARWRRRGGERKRELIE